MQDNKKSNKPLLFGSVLLASITAQTTMATENPFQVTPLAQGYMMIAENTLPNAQTNASGIKNTDVQSQLKPIANTNDLALKKTTKSTTEGGCGTGACNAKMKKAKLKLNSAK